MRHLLLAATLSVIPGLAWASDEGNCYNALKLSEGFNPGLARISAAEPKTFFRQNRSSGKSCPSEAAACKGKAYLIPGDEVFAGPPQGDYICAAKLGAKGRVTTGWLRKADLAAAPDAAITSNDWLGTWQAPEQKIVVKKGRKPGTLAFDATATFGALDPERVKRGAVNIGDFNAEWKPNGDYMAFAIGDKGTLPIEQGEEYGCKVHLLRIGAYLVAEDNSQCGGVNVSFTGVYTRKK